MTLVLGQPGSGKSSLLQLLSGRFPLENNNVALEGEIAYNDEPRESLDRRLPQFAAYVAQQDLHLSTLTVRETHEFAHTCSTAYFGNHVEELLSRGAQPEDNAEVQATARSLLRHLPQITLELLGLQQCADTIIGGNLLRGVSGGERKRVTTGEMLVGFKLALFLDSITTGLDSAAAFDIISSLRGRARSFGQTVVAALLQPAPEVFELFDDVLLLMGGRVAYHGPVSEVRGYFEALGFYCPPGRDFADFLMDLGTEDQLRYQTIALPSNQALPRTAKQFAAVFSGSLIHQRKLQELQTLVDPGIVEGAHKYMDTIPEFQQGFVASTWTLVRREMLVLSRNVAFVVGRAVMTVIMGLLYASTFYDFDATDVQVIMGVVFSVIFFVSLGQAAQIPTLFEARDIFYRQRRANFYRSSSFVLASALSHIPVALFETFVFGSLIYWLCGFVPEAELFVRYEAIVFLSSLAYGAWYFLLVALTPNMNVAMPMAMLSVLVMATYAGFAIPKDQLPDYLLWLYWASPVAWGIRGLAVNQFRAARFDICVYEGVDYCSLSGGTMGEYYLSLFDVPASKSYVDLSMVFVVGCYLLFLGLSVWALEHRRFEGPEDTSASASTDENDNPSDELYGLLKTPRGTESVEIAIQPSSGKRNFVPVTLAFEDIWYSGMLQILKGVSGFARPGFMTALMGSSGAGKTTLMDVIAHRKTGGSVRGRILLNGHEASDLAMRRCTGYCEQTDVHCEGATFREALTFSAFLRQPADVPSSVKRDTVRECLDLLDLHSIADRIVRGASMEQLKRLTVGVELAAQPSILFLDEPTSGLDAAAAKTIMEGVKKVARSGRTVITTIHQPSAEVFGLFDSVLLLQRGGRTVFFGDVGPQCRDLVQYFEQLPGVSPLQPEANPATWMLECIGAGVNTGDKSSGNAAAVDFADVFQSSKLREQLDATMKEPGVACPSESQAELTFARKRAAGPLVQLHFLVQRSFRSYWRTASYNITRVGISLILALIFGISFLEADYGSYAGANAGVGMLFIATGFNGIVSFFGVLPVAVGDRASFYRERGSQCFSAFWYFVAGSIVEIPYVFASTLLFSVIFYPMVGFTGGIASGALFWVNTALLVLLQVYMGQLLAYALPTAELAMVVGVVVNTASFLFMGFNPPVHSIPAGYKWLYQIVPLRYSFSALTALVFADCPAAGDSDIGCQELRDAPVTLTFSNVKEYVEYTFGARHDEFVRNMGVVVLIIVILRILALLALRFINYERR
ncbi:pleiotropic drug resistance protein ABC superfamily [Phytophthora sojae]|uniref:Pleiotropic drug resistance protein ABC superfamily n=1 Tax=Phytophthora sojae (strain P6497) TaxID=1094619 RepID=G4YS08_PHYSP|nr:pleiotropic drug resistance protein ABC superfamily [Phytophthora sojae]EGZ24145.1 pleiotropic drug resistance protein ABC superfamily [Phytophthora sojae]|eukprot:XP_009519433.1 pleiotropic drug resistance protein ABC superfamily [Phytophthora sojae]